MPPILDAAFATSRVMITGPYSAVRDFVTVYLYPVVLVGRSDDSARSEARTGRTDLLSRRGLRGSVSGGRDPAEERLWPSWEIHKNR